MYAGAGLMVILLAVFTWMHYRGGKAAMIPSHYVFGIDFSGYQGRVDWNGIDGSKHPIEYVIVRSTMGADGLDSQFRRNWEQAGLHGYIRGAYHYYRPYENSGKQFSNYATVVVLEPGDLPPILDIEQLSPYGQDNLRRGVLNWLKLAEEHYGVSPILYTGRHYYRRHLKGHVEGYPLWIASYSPKWKLRRIDWTFHQFSDRVRVSGIGDRVDGNDFNGTLEELKALCIKDE
jgi:GH25 family lysozyme M1 (1,4-beta-N-acetylmuramidase)